MELVQPAEISGKIMTLIDESDEFVIIVSPYVKITKWYKLLKKFDNLKTRKVPVKFIVRDEKSNQTTIDELDELGYDYKSLKDLHCKLYLNEEYAIVSSMNLLLSSEINSIEIAYKTENKNEYDEIVEFCKRHLGVNFNFNNKTNDQFKGDWRDYINDKLTEMYNGSISIRQNEHTLEIHTTTNNYSCFICNERENKLRISGILTTNEHKFLIEHPDYLAKIQNLKIDIYKPLPNYQNKVWGTYEKALKSKCIDDLHDLEKNDVAQKIIEFVLMINKFKSSDFYNYDKRGW